MNLTDVYLDVGHTRINITIFLKKKNQFWIKNIINFYICKIVRNLNRYTRRGRFDKNYWISGRPYNTYPGRWRLRRYSAKKSHKTRTILIVVTIIFDIIDVTTDFGSFYEKVYTFFTTILICQPDNRNKTRHSHKTHNTHKTKFMSKLITFFGLY